MISWCYSTYGMICKDIYGIIWGGGTKTSFYSPIGSIEEDLGYLDVS